MQILGHWRSQGHRALLFAQTQQMLDILEIMAQVDRTHSASSFCSCVLATVHVSASACLLGTEPSDALNRPEQQS
jgi:hypothetical protein